MYNYEELVKLVPELGEHVKNDKLDYTCPTAVRLLNQALLLNEFNLRVVLPEGHLCPTIPNRTGYIKQIEMLLKDVFKVPLDTPVIGIDIGTGTSCVYPLIGCSRNSNWIFFATDIDDKIIEFAQKNLYLNPRLIDRINIIKNDDPLLIFPESLQLSSNPHIPKFALCNPPFYTDIEDLESRRSFKRHKPTSDRCEMVDSELGTELGGEVGFIKKMIDESTALISTNIRLFSCMLGMKESLIELLVYLQSFMQIKSFAYELLQIKHTCRYALFWSFSDEIPKESSTHRLKITAKSKRTQTITIIEGDLNVVLKDIRTKYGEVSDAVTDSLLLELKQNKWSRKYRRSPETAPLLPNPLTISISIAHHTNFELEFTLVNDEADWELFLGFINHLRKEYQ